MERVILPQLCQAGVLERHATRLRVSPRFLGYLDEVAQRQGVALRFPALPLLETALAQWDAYHGPTRDGARYLSEFLTERNQWGSLRQHVVLDAFVAA